MENFSEKKTNASDHLANERTFLAWIRTSIAIMGFGFVVVKFSLFMKQLAFVLGENAVVPTKTRSSVIGIGLVAIGGVMTLLSYFRYRAIEKKLIKGNYYPSFGLTLSLTLAIVAVCIVLVIYLVPGL